MRHLAVTLFAATFVCAQSPTDVFEKAPPDVDKALRERVAVFFQAHVDAKFRRAEQVIHEDNLDDFYNSEKTKLIKFEISKISYAEKFTKAVVITDVELDWVTSRGIIRVKPPMKTLWKVDKGQWWWYAPPPGNWETPFGTMKSSTDPKAGPSAPVSVNKMVDPNEVLNAIKASKTSVQLDSVKRSSDSAEISADLPGEVRLEVQPHGIPGLNVRFENQNVRQGQPGIIHFDYEPPDETAKAPRIVYIHVNPMGKVISFTLNFRQPAPQAKPQFTLPAGAASSAPKR